MLKAFGFGGKELTQFKTCIMKVPILAQCLADERAKANFRPVATSAASSAYTPLLSGEDENKCSQEELYGEIKRLYSDRHVPTRELIACYRELHDNPEKSIKLKAQIEDAKKKKVYKKICLLLDRWAVEKTNLDELLSLAISFSRKEEYDRALPLYEELLAKQKRFLGEYHPETLASFRSVSGIKHWFEVQRFNSSYQESQRSYQEAQQKLGEEQKEGTGASLGGKNKNKRNHKNKSFRSTRRRRYSRARGGKKIAASSSKTIKRRRKNAR